MIRGASPKVSIGLPVFNGERYLRQMLDSILAQTFTDFELIISDNASTDGTSDICRDYDAKDSRICYHRNQENLGAARNFNQAFHLSNGVYFRWASADDFFARDSIERCVDVLDSNPEVVLCYPRTILIDDQGNIIRPYKDNLDLQSDRAAERFALALERIGLVNVHYGLMRSSALRRSALMKNYPGSDVALIAELTLHGKFWEIRETHFYRRMHRNASSSMRTDEELQKFMDPQKKRTAGLPLLRRHLQYFLALSRTRLSTSERAHIAYIIARSAAMSRHKLLHELYGALRCCVGRPMY
jgi:glycosyltransferase involved in cell wall biosynthesis